MKKLYSVTITGEVVVVADSIEDAERIAEHDVDHFDMQLSASADRHGFFMPYGWDDGSIPFGEGDKANPDKTIAEWKEEARLAKLEAEFAAEFAAKQIPLFPAPPSGQAGGEK